MLQSMKPQIGERLRLRVRVNRHYSAFFSKFIRRHFKGRVSASGSLSTRISSSENVSQDSSEHRKQSFYHENIEHARRTVECNVAEVFVVFDNGGSIGGSC